MQLTNSLYGRVLQEKEDIYFQLRGRGFIEMIRQVAELQNPSAKAKRGKSSKSAMTNGHGSATGETGVFENQMELDDEVAIEDGMDIEPDSGASMKHQELLSMTLAYGQELQSEFKDDPRGEVKQALRDMFGLLAYPDPRQSSVAHLLAVEGRARVAEELNSAILGQSTSIYSYSKGR